MVWHGDKDIIGLARDKHWLLCMCLNMFTKKRKSMCLNIPTKNKKVCVWIFSPMRVHTRFLRNTFLCITFPLAVYLQRLKVCFREEKPMVKHMRWHNMLSLSVGVIFLIKLSVSAIWFDAGPPWLANCTIPSS